MSVHKLPASTNELEKAQTRPHSEDVRGSDDRRRPRSGSVSGESSSTGEDNDEDWNDWVSNEEDSGKPCVSLFDGSSHPGADEALAHDKEKFGVDFQALAVRLHLDFHGRVRLVNYIRKEKPSAIDINTLTGQEAFFASDEYLIPIIEDDPLLQLESEDWSEDEEISVADLKGKDKDKALQIALRNLEQAKKDLADFRALVEKQLNVTEIRQALQDDTESSIKEESESKRDDDTHYFESYGENEIHYVMLRDKVRTSTYASFILNSPDLFRDAIVLDVGCGTGILSLFAARAGAKRVFAVDASKNIVEKARQIVKLNSMEDVISVIHGKVEDITLPDGVTQVDVIVSEWMGYALLYESMLDSVLVARDRFLKPPIKTHTVLTEERGRERDDHSEERKESGGILAPSQARMLLGLSSATEVMKDRVEFWTDVYGYDMSPMTEGIYNDAVIEAVPPESMLSDTTIVQDINTATASPNQLSFSAPFELHGTSPRRTVAHAFILYFDIFFTQDGAQVAPEVHAKSSGDGEAMLAEVWRPQSRTRSPSMPRSPTRRERMRRQSSIKVPKEEPKWKSFTTGPESVPTHWKQTLFLLKEPFVVREGTTVSGTFHCRKSADNSRELDVELHYVVRDTDTETGHTEESSMIVQSFKVR